jgi:glycogen operon protein
MMLNGHTLGAVDDLGNPVVDDSFLLLLNAGSQSVEFVPPPAPGGGGWKCLLNTSRPANPFKSSPAGKRVKLRARSLLLLSEPRQKLPPL